MRKLRELKYKLLKHPPNLPELALFNHLVSNLKEIEARNLFLSNNEVIAVEDGHFADLLESHFRYGFLCTEVKGNYIKN